MNRVQNRFPGIKQIPPSVSVVAIPIIYLNSTVDQIHLEMNKWDVAGFSN
jgi:hypothetical protein